MNERSRALLLDLGVVQALLQAAQRSLELPCVAHSHHQEAYLAGGKITQAQRNQLQVCNLLWRNRVDLAAATLQKPDVFLGQLLLFPLGC